MRIFVLEDKPERIITFHDAFKPVGSILVDYIQTANLWAEFDPPYDYVFLDHDLGGREGERHEDCGLTFLMQTQRRLETMAKWDADGVEIILHTYNSDAAGRMLEYLAAKVPTLSAKWMPFMGEEFKAKIAEICNSKTPGV